MTLRASTGPGRGREHVPGSCKDLQPGKETTARRHDAVPADVVASPERPEACAVALAGVRAKT